MRGKEEEYNIYDVNENFLYKKVDRENGIYHYRNFVCDYTNIGSEIRYSYDNGKTWTEHYVSGMSILRRMVGFYKDQFLVTEAIYFHGESPESGGRIMVGKFKKPIK